MRQRVSSIEGDFACKLSKMRRGDGRGGDRPETKRQSLMHYNVYPTEKRTLKFSSVQFIMFYCFVLHIVLYCCDTTIRAWWNKDYENSHCIRLHRGVQRWSTTYAVPLVVMATSLQLHSAIKKRVRPVIYDQIPSIWWKFSWKSVQWIQT